MKVQVRLLHCFVLLVQHTMALFSRSIRKIVPATQNGPVHRLIGTVDVDGKGTVHPLEEVDPFMLLDAATVPKPNLPTFGKHPHRGHSVVTLLLQGRAKSWDSFSQKQTVLTAPSSYWVDAGSGLFHEELSVMDTPDDPPMKLLQLWIGVREADRLKPARVQYAADLPTEEIVNADNVAIGKKIQFVGESTALDTPHPIEVTLIQQDANAVYDHPIDPKHEGFVVLLQGTGGSFAGSAPQNTYDVLVLDEASSSDNKCCLRVESTNGPLEYMVCVGEPNREPWFKKLVANGAVVASSAEEAREMAQDVERYSTAGKQEGGSFAPWGA